MAAEETVDIDLHKLSMESSEANLFWEYSYGYGKDVSNHMVKSAEKVLVKHLDRFTRQYVPNNLFTIRLKHIWDFPVTVNIESSVIKFLVCLMMVMTTQVCTWNAEDFGFAWPMVGSCERGRQISGPAECTVRFPKTAVFRGVSLFNIKNQWDCNFCNRVFISAQFLVWPWTHVLNFARSLVGNVH
jgi:hypothetical protein